MKRTPLPALLALLACLAAAQARADQPAPADSAGPPGPPREVRITRAVAPVSLDGNLSEAAWQSCQVISGFKQRDPNEGVDASQPTEVRLLYDDDGLYVGARMHDNHADSIVTRLTRRDAQGARSDLFMVFIDPFYDRRSGYFFGVNAAGTLFDGTLYNDGWSDNSWDGVWDGRAKIDGQGWTVEMHIPFSQLRFAKAEPQRWGINFHRSIARGFEDDYLVYQPKKESGFVSRFPTLVGLENVSPRGAIEIVPYATSKAELIHHGPLDPFLKDVRLAANGGGDLRMALGDKLTLNATINPDFGQVEVDPAVVNLSDVETFFPEKRPFFVEGSSIFDAGQQGASDYWGFNWQQPTFFYSRRIGRAPAGSLPDDTDYKDVPNGTTILGAAKVSGKIGSGTNFGMLHALTSKETADFQRTGPVNVDQYEVEPLTYYGVARALKEFPERRHGLGLISTVTARRFDARRLESEFNRASLVTAADGWTFLDKSKTWVLSGWAGASYVTGTASRLTDIQSNPRHYYQRPDAKSYSLDTTATSLSGTGARLWLNKEKGNWFSNSAIGYLSPGFEVNDIGFLNRADLVNAHFGIGYKWTKPTKHVRKHHVLGALFGGTNFDGDLTSLGFWGKKFWWFNNNWVTEIRYAYYPETVDPRRSRGGPRMLNKPGYELGLFADTDGARVRYYFIDAGASTNPEENSWWWTVNPGVTYKPVSNVQIQLGPGLTRSRDGAYYFATVSDASAAATYGSRYIFADLEQTTLSANIRFNVSFTPAMSLEFFGQPLFSTADYSGVKELARPKSLDFIGQGAGAWTFDPATNRFDPDGAGPKASYIQDFNFKSLRGNAVFRWEYMPGSTLFLVWTHERKDEESIDNFQVGPSWHRLLRADADNIFLAKVTYYLSR
jgi:Domain of unknown function (DUF5916)/Carbohydrate family 9 binding domain-like